MIRGSLFVQHRFLIFLLLSLMAVMGLFGCVEGGNTSSTAQDIVCTPNPSTVNVYRATPQQWPNMIFQTVVSTTPVAATMPASPDLDLLVAGVPPGPPNAGQLLFARSFALQCLVNETERWSDVQIIKLNDSRDAQITVTYISPELLQAVFLGEVLNNQPLISDFDTQVQTMLGSVASRDELLFLFTLTMINKGSTDSPIPVLDLPIIKMVLTNGAWLEVKPKHADQILDQPINLSDGSVFGYFAYPLAVLDNKNVCNWVLEPKYNTSLVITMPNHKLDGVEINIPHSWTIPYSSLIHVESPEDLITSCMSAIFDENQLSPAKAPPISKNDSAYWLNFARFVWNQVAHGNY